MTAVWLFFYVMTWQQYSPKWRGKMWQPSGGGQRAETNKAWPLPYQLKQTWPLLYQLKQTKHNPCCINWNKTWPLLYQLKQNMTPAVPTEKEKKLTPAVPTETKHDPGVPTETKLTLLRQAISMWLCMPQALLWNCYTETDRSARNTVALATAPDASGQDVLQST